MKSFWRRRRERHWAEVHSGVVNAVHSIVPKIMIEMLGKVMESRPVHKRYEHCHAAWQQSNLDDVIAEYGKSGWWVAHISDRNIIFQREKRDSDVEVTFKRRIT